MAIVVGDILFKLSVTTGPGDANAQADVNQSLGEFMSSTEIVDATLNNLFDDVSGDENAANDVEYRCIFVHNNHASLTWQNVKVWLSAETAGGADIAIALDDSGVVDDDLGTAQAEEVADEDTAPVGESFSSPTTKAGGLSIGDIPPQDCQAIWLRRTAANTVALDNDDVTIRCEGDTAA